VIIGIDGRCAAGKTTLAGELCRQLEAGVIALDHFFLRPNQRTIERLAQPGGRVDWERFNSEVLPDLLAGEPVSYRPYDCQRETLGEPINVPNTAITIVEGAYALHPHLADIYDFSLFLDVDEPTQRQRLMARSPALLDRFLDDWIPAEEAYFQHFAIMARADRVSQLALLMVPAWRNTLIHRFIAATRRQIGALAALTTLDRRPACLRRCRLAITPIWRRSRREQSVDQGNIVAKPS
jgi:dephospho-CoA kinase